MMTIRKTRGVVGLMVLGSVVLLGTPTLAGSTLPLVLSFQPERFSIL